MTPPEPPDITRIIVNQNPPGTDDTVSGTPGAVEENACVVIYADPELTREIGRIQAHSNGGFPPISIGDNLYETVYIVAEDASGNRSAYIVVNNDITPPDTNIVSTPQDPTSSTLATFEFISTENDSTFKCKLDTGHWYSCTSPEILTGLAEGSHVFKVYAIDSAGNIDSTPAVYTWTIDTTPPDTSITSFPQNPTCYTYATFTFTSTEENSTFMCQIDNGGWYECDSPHAVDTPSEGLHVFTVKAVDQVGNSDPTPDTFTWEIKGNIAEAVDNAEYAWITGGDSIWYRQRNEYVHDGDAARSGAIRDNERTYFQTTITVPADTTGSINFYWKVSSERGGDFLSFYVDNLTEASISGDVDWEFQSFKITSGTHTLKWEYSKNEALSIDSDAGWVDWILIAVPEILWNYYAGDRVLSSPALGDVDNDGKLEVVIGANTNYVYAFNGEDGTQLWAYNTGNTVVSSPAIGDIDSDGILEVVVGSTSGNVYALNGENGTVLWTYSTTGAVYSSPAIGDIDNDGKPEVVVGSGDYNVYALNGEDGSLLWLYTTGNRIGYSSPALGDICGNGRLEVVIGSSDGYVYALSGGTGALLWQYDTGAGFAVNSSPSLADVNGDGTLDVIVGSTSNYIYALRGDTGLECWTFYTDGDVTSSPALGDINNDGQLEVVFGSDDGKVYALRSTSGVQLWYYNTFNPVKSSPALGDVDGDGKIEVIVGSGNYKLYVLNGEDGSFLWAYSTGDTIFSSPALGDINGDGRLDVVVGSFSGYICALSTRTNVPIPALLPWPELGNRSYNRTRNLDPWEYNDRFTRPSRIADLSRNGAVPGYIWKGGDVDYYSFPVMTTPATITVRLENIPAAPNYDLFLYDPLENLLGQSTNEANADEAITFPVNATGTYSIKVTSSYGNSPAEPYSLYIRVDP